MTSRFFAAPSALCLAGMMLSTATPAAAEDKSVESRLDKAGLQYDMDEDGDYRVVFDYTSEGRTQLAFVAGRTETVGGVAIRELFAPAAMVEKHGVDGAKALDLLKASARAKVGSWEIRGDFVYFVVKVNDEMTAAEMRVLLNTAASTADDLEIELTGGQDEL